jgi:hypothetical protein
MKKAERLMQPVRQILLTEWDPLGVADIPECFDEYDYYARTVCRYLEDGTDEFKLTAYLAQVRAISMGLSHFDDERDQRVVRRLLALLER